MLLQKLVDIGRKDVLGGCPTSLRSFPSTGHAMASDELADNKLHASLVPSAVESSAIQEAEEGRISLN